MLALGKLGKGFLKGASRSNIGKAVSTSNTPSTASTSNIGKAASTSNTPSTVSTSNTVKAASGDLIDGASKFANENPQVVDKVVDKVFEGNNLQKITNLTGYKFGPQKNFLTFGFFFVYTIIILSILVNDANKFRKKEEEKNYKKLLQISLVSLFILGLFSMFKFMYQKQQFIPIKFLLYFCLPLCINIVIYFLILKLSDLKEINTRNWIYTFLYLLSFILHIIPSFYR